MITWQLLDFSKAFLNSKKQIVQLGHRPKLKLGPKLNTKVPFNTTHHHHHPPPPPHPTFGPLPVILGG